MSTKSLQSCPTLCDPMDCRPPGSSVHGILQARIMEWVTMPFSKRSSQPRDRSCVSYVSCMGRQVLYHYHHLGRPAAAAAAAAKLLQSCPTLHDPTDGSPPGSPIPGILQARTLEWVAISFSSAWKWKVKGSRSVVSDSSQPHGLQPTRLLHPWDFPGKSTGVGCHCLLWGSPRSIKTNKRIVSFGFTIMVRLIWVQLSSFLEKMEPIPVFFPGKSHEQRCPWVCKELDTT